MSAFKPTLGTRKKGTRQQRITAASVGRYLTADLRPLPDFVILGAQRGGTTSLYEWLDRMAAADASRRDFVEADLHLHLEIARIAGNPFLPALSSLIEVALVTALTRSSPLDEVGGVARSTAEHRAIVDAIARADEPAARVAMRHVVEEGIRHAASGFQRSVDAL